MLFLLEIVPKLFHNYTYAFLEKNFKNTAQEASMGKERYQQTSGS